MGDLTSMGAVIQSDYTPMHGNQFDTTIKGGWSFLVKRVSI